jgi:SAM-dependent methyltransferase
VVSDYYLDPRIAAAYDADHAARGAIAVDDIPFYAGLAMEAAAAGLPVLELGCGTGRVAIPIAQAGVPVVGFDSSPAMLAIARRKSAGLAHVRWVEGDMRDFGLEERFGLVISPFRSFQLLLTVADQLACLARIRQHLVKGGRLAFNIFNPDIVMMGRRIADLANAGFDISTYVSAGRRVRQRASPVYRRAEQLIEEERAADELSDEGAIISRQSKTLRLRYIFRYEMEHLLVRSGFEVEALYGWFDGRPFADDSTEMVWVARQP